MSDTPFMSADELQELYESAEGMTRKGSGTMTIDCGTIRRIVRELTALRAENERLRAELERERKVSQGWRDANSPGGWIDDLRERCRTAENRVLDLEAAILHAARKEGECQ